MSILNDDVFDSRDVNAALADYELGMTPGFQDWNADDGPYPELEDETEQAFAERIRAAHGDEDADDYLALIDLRDQLNTWGSDWNDGMTIVVDGAFEDYAEQVARDVGLIDDTDGWPLYHIDWAAAADSLKRDYSEATVNGTVYYAR